jgi:mRNA interferase MazF
LRRGEIWWAKLPGPRRSRPVLLLSRDEAYSRRTYVTVSPLTRSVRDLPTEVSLQRRDGVPQGSVVNLDDLLTIPLASLDRYVTTLSAEKMRQVTVAIKFALDLG